MLCVVNLCLLLFLSNHAAPAFEIINLISTSFWRTTVLLTLAGTMAISNFTILKYTPMDAGFSSPRRTEFGMRMSPTCLCAACTRKTRYMRCSMTTIKSLRAARAINESFEWLVYSPRARKRGSRARPRAPSRTLLAKGQLDELLHLRLREAVPVFHDGLHQRVEICAEPVALQVQQALHDLLEGPVLVHGNRDLE